MLKNVFYIMFLISFSSFSQDNDDCFSNFENAFKERGSYFVADDIHSNVIICFFHEVGNVCLEGKVRVEENSITAVFIKLENNSYVHMKEKFYSESKKTAPQILNGISEMAQNSKGEKFKIIFINSLKPEVKYKFYSESKSNYKDSNTIVIQMSKMFGGTYEIPCTVNGLKLNFIFDTGASDVTISLTEALFMFKNGYLNEEDIIGSEYYSIANGDIAEGTIIRIKEIKFGGITLYNVKASIIHHNDAPLLLGQSVISRLGKILIDPQNSTLTIIK